MNRISTGEVLVYVALRGGTGGRRPEDACLSAQEVCDRIGLGWLVSESSTRRHLEALVKAKVAVKLSQPRARFRPLAFYAIPALRTITERELELKTIANTLKETLACDA